MWFAALSHYQHEPWLAFFLYRLLTNQPEVLRLIQTNPFPITPPKPIGKNLLLDIVRSISNLMNGTIFTWFPVIIALVFVILRKVLCRNPHQAVVIKKDNEWYQTVPLKDKDK